MKNNIPNEGELPEFDPNEYGGDELGRCKSYLKKTVELLEKECEKNAELERQLQSREDCIDSLYEDLEQLQDQIEILEAELE